MEERALYVPDGDAYVGTNLIPGGWDRAAANGGMVLALLGHCLEDVPSLVPMTMSRFTVDLVRPVPLGRRLHVVPTVLREGKKIQVVQLQLLVDDVEHVRATALRLRDADLSGPDVPPSTTTERPADVLVPVTEVDGLGELGPDAPGFTQAVDMRRAPTTDGSGRGTWIRLVAPVVAGEPIRPTSRMAFAFDFSNLIGVVERPTTVTMINPDVTAHVLRPPTGEWIAIVGDTRFNAAMGRGLSYSTLNDDDGLFGVVSISQLLQRR